MPPKLKFTKDDIISAAVRITRARGISAVTARAVAAELGSSAKPIFSHFTCMEEITGEVVRYAEALYGHYIKSGMESGEYPPYKASGIAYIRFARDEKELFKLLFMRDRHAEIPADESDADHGNELRDIIPVIMQNLGVDEDTAFRLHMELWVYVHGIATMTASGYLDWDTEFIDRSLTDVYVGLKYRLADIAKNQTEGQ